MLLCMAALLWVSCGTPSSEAPPSEVASEVDSDNLYTCGMHPEVIQEGPGQCPICNMDLTSMKLGPAKGSEVVVSSATTQNMGIRTERVARQPLFRHLRTIGEVEVGEDQVSVVNLRFGGWAEKIHVDRTGDPVKRGQVLFDIYSPELVTAQEEYLAALRAGADSPLAASARRRLELWGIATSDLDRVAEAGNSSRTLPVRAPQDGYVLHKQLVEGARVEAGKDLYRVGNLTTIWVTAEVYEHDAPYVSIGQPAQMELSFHKGTSIEGQVSWVYPTLNPISRTLPIRLEFNNPGLQLKPGMFATVYIEFQRIENVIAVPSEAILRSGRRALVFVHTGDGHFDAREITTGLVGDRHLTEVLTGLDEGDEVVISGQFLLDAESQLQEAVAKLMGGKMTPAEAAPQTGYACPMHPAEHSDELDRCSICGMDLVEVTP
jgi:multidrug efflux pump subunit AcrA (membrane-fusion protein)